MNMNNKGYDSGIVRERAASRRACTKELLFFGAQLPELGCRPRMSIFSLVKGEMRMCEWASPGNRWQPGVANNISKKGTIL